MVKTRLDTRQDSRRQLARSSNAKTACNLKRADTQLPQSRAGGQGLYLRSLHHLGRSSEAKDRKKVKCDGPMDG